MPEQGKPLEPHNNFRDKCYRTKDDHRHATTFVSLSIPKDRWEEIFGITEEERLERLKQYKCSKVEHSEVDFPNISKWSTEFSYMATGKRLTKKQLKEYCKKNNKEWLNE